MLDLEYADRAYSDVPATEGTDCYLAELAVAWEGWRHVKLSLHRDFASIRSPAGWRSIDNITIAGSGWGLTPVPGTELHFDDMRLTRNPWEPILTVSDMEEPTWPWQGLVRDTKQVRSGEHAGKWSDLTQTPFVRLTRLPHDWTSFEALTLWCYSPEPNGTKLKILLYSDNPGTEKMDCYGVTFPVSWQGWHQLTFQRRHFRAHYEPVGWHKIDHLTIVGQGFGLVAKPDTVLWFDDVALVRAEPQG